MNIKIVLSSLLVIVQELEADANKYLNSFDSISAFSFESNEETVKSHAKKYLAFSVCLSKHMVECEKLIAELSKEIRITDQECETDKVLFLSQCFDDHMKFTETINYFVIKNDRIFNNKSNDFKVSLIIENTRILLASILNYNNLLKEKI